MEQFNIQVASKISGISAHTIRAWEKRYGALRPKRSANGRRLYLEADLERLTMLAKLSQMGHSIGQIANLEDSELSHMLGKFQDRSHSHGPRTESSRSAHAFVPLDVDSVWSNLQMGIGAKKIEIIYHELEKARSNMDAQDFLRSIAIPLYEQWHQLHKDKYFDDIEIEAFNTIVSFQLSQMSFDSETHKTQVGPKTLVCNYARRGGSISSKILFLIGDQCSLQCSYLGEIERPEAVAKTARALDAEMLVLDVSKPQNLHELRPSFFEETVEAIHKYCPKATVWFFTDSEAIRIPVMGHYKVRFLKDFDDTRKAFEDLSHYQVSRDMPVYVAIQG